MKKNLRKVLAMALSAVMVMGVAACSSSSTETEQEDSVEETTEDSGEKTVVGIIQMADNDAFTDMREGFIAELAAQGFDDSNTEIIYKNAQGDASTLNTICQQMVTDDVDLVCTIATPSTQAMVNMKSDIPVVFVAVSNPINAGVLTTFEDPDMNATGTSNPIPVDGILELAGQITPDAKKFGILYTSSEVNSVDTANKAKEYMDANGIEYTEIAITNSSEVQQAAQQLCSEVDAIFVPNDAVVQSAMPVVTAAAREAGVAVYGSSAVMVTSGALATVAISDTEIGAISADMAIEILNGKTPAEVPAVAVPGTEVVINKTTKDAIGADFEITDDMIVIED